MRSSLLMKNRGWTGSAVLLGTLALTAGSLVAWKHASVRKADAAAARQPEPIESVTLAVAKERQYRPTTTSVGTILALNSITLRNELAGTVRQVSLVPANRRNRRGARRPRCLRGGSGASGRAGPGRPGGNDPGAPRGPAGGASHIPGRGGPGPRGARHRAGAARAHTGDHRQEDDPRPVPRARGDLRCASRAVPERRHRAHHAAGGRCRRQRGLHGRSGGGGRAASRR